MALVPPPGSPSARTKTGGAASHPKRATALPVVHQCPVCREPQTKIQRRLGNEKYGSVNYVCARAQCAVGIDLKKVDTWVVF